MFRTACIFAALALCAATAPPRISLELASDNWKTGTTNTLPVSGKADHPLVAGATNKDVAKSCEADNSGSSAANAALCDFPIAKAYDHLDDQTSATINVQTVIKLLDTLKEDLTDPVAVADQVYASLADLTNPRDSLPAVQTRSTYIFEYDAHDQAMNHAAQVTFVLVINDVTKPGIDTTTAGVLATNTCEAGAQAMDICARDVELPNHWTCTDPTLLDTMVATVVETSTCPPTWIEWTRAHTCGVGCTISTQATCTDHADRYGEGGVSNSDDKTYTRTVTDNTAPVFSNHDDVSLECDRARTGITESDFAFTTALDNTYTMSAAYMADVTYYAVDTNAVTAFNAAWHTSKLIDSADGLDVQTTTLSFGAKDGCDNEASTSRVITVTDTTPPTFTAEANMNDASALVTERNQGHPKAAHKIENGIRTFDISPNNHALFAEKCESHTNGGITHQNFGVAQAAACKAAIEGGLETVWSCTDASECHLDSHSVDTSKGFMLHANAQFSDTCCLDVNTMPTATWTTPFDPKIVGTYTRQFTKFDCTGVHSASVDFTVVLQDIDAPIIHMESCDPINYVRHGVGGSALHQLSNTVTDGCRNIYEASNAVEYTDSGAQCHDYVDGVLSHAVEVSGQVVNMRIVGTYLISYNCADLSGNAATPVTRTVIIEDTTPPTLRFDSARSQGVAMNFVEAGFPYDDAGVTMSDSLDMECIYDDVEISADVAYCNSSGEHGVVGKNGDTVTDGEKYWEKPSCNAIKTALTASALPLTNGQYIITTTAAQRTLVNCYFGEVGTPIANAITFIVYTGGDFQVAPASGDCTNTLGSNAERMGAGAHNVAALKQSPEFLGMSGPTATQAAIDYTDAVESQHVACVINNNAAADADPHPNDALTQTNALAQVNRGHAEPGVYVITFWGNDRVGNQAVNIMRTVIVKDTLPPVISLLHPDSGAVLAQGDSKVVGLDSRTNYDAGTGAAHHAYMAETTSVNGWFIGAVACAVSGVALLATSMKKTPTSVPV
jgi:hypothetical protein